MSEVRHYAATIDLPEAEVEKFYDHYEANGWKVGKNAMKCWQAALRNWKRSWREHGGKARPTKQDNLNAYLEHLKKGKL